MYHCCCVIVFSGSARKRRALKARCTPEDCGPNKTRSTSRDRLSAARLALIAKGVDALAGIRLEFGDGRRVEPEQVRKLREVNTLGAGHVFVGPQYRIRK